MTRHDHTARLVSWAIALVAFPLIGWAVVESWPLVYAFLRANPFALLFICGGLALAYVVFLLWWQARPAPSHIFCAEESRKPWEEVE